MKRTVMECMTAAALTQQFPPMPEDLPTKVGLYVRHFQHRGLTDADAGRIRYAFDSWVLQNNHFPAPADIIAGLPRKLHQPVTPDRQLEHDSEAAQSRSDALAREHIGKWRAIADDAWRDGDEFTEELALKYCRDIDTSPEGIKKEIEGNVRR